MFSLSLPPMDHFDQANWYDVPLSPTALRRCHPSLDRMEAKGVLTRSPHPDNARGVLVTITDKGSHTVEELFPLLARKVIAPLTSHFTDDEVKTIAELLSRL